MNGEQLVPWKILLLFSVWESNLCATQNACYKFFLSTSNSWFWMKKSAKDKREVKIFLCASNSFCSVSWNDEKYSLRKSQLSFHLAHIQSLLKRKIFKKNLVIGKSKKKFSKFLQKGLLSHWFSRMMLWHFTFLTVSVIYHWCYDDFMHFILFDVNTSWNLRKAFLLLHPRSLSHCSLDAIIISKQINGKVFNHFLSFSLPWRKELKGNSSGMCEEWKWICWKCHAHLGNWKSRSKFSLTFFVNVREWKCLWCECVR